MSIEETRMTREKALREHLHNLLAARQAHVDFETALANLPEEARGRRADACPNTPWQILEHMRIAQWDIVEFSRNPDHVSPEFPEGYWPPSESPPDEEAWDVSVSRFRDDLRGMMDLVADPRVDLFARLPHGTGQTVLREAMVLADHNAYHLGQLVVLRRALGCWPKEQ